MTANTVHIPVLPDEVLKYGAPNPGETWVDGTAGGGGHCQLLIQAVTKGDASGRVLGLDRDPAVAMRLREVFATQIEIGSFYISTGSYETAPECLAELSWKTCDGILLDLGLSSDQLADRERGFSFQSEGKLDMRFDPTQGIPVWQWLESVEEKELANVLFRYGEEKFSRRIARSIVQLQSEKRTPRTANELRQIIHSSVPKNYDSGKQKKIDPATRSFQALRIAINDELGILERSLSCLPDCLAEGGRLAIISFHSLEDRMVKHAFRSDDRLEVLTKRPIAGTEEEITNNPRARSAKLRVARRISHEAQQQIEDERRAGFRV